MTSRRLVPILVAFVLPRVARHSPVCVANDEVASDAAEPMDGAVVHGRGRRCGLDRARLSISGFRRPAPGHEGRGEREDGEQRTAAHADRGAQPGSAAACLRAAK